MVPKQTIEAVKITGPAILILMIGLLWIYDSCFARPARVKAEKIEDVLVKMRDTLSRIDERTVLLMQAHGIVDITKIKNDQ